MSLTQMQIIQSLGEAMTWFEREIEWGVAPTELRHLCGRIGELYAALITNGQMTENVNQSGFDVISSSGQRISVKTTATMRNAGVINFNLKTLAQVDRVIVLRINTDEMQVETLLDSNTDEALQLMAKGSNGKGMIHIGKLLKKNEPKRYIKTKKEVIYRGISIRELETGTIEVAVKNRLILPAKPKLRELATELGLEILNDNGNPRNTRQLGGQIIRKLSSEAE